MAVVNRCPQCKRKLALDAFQCPDCELILEGAVLGEEEHSKEHTLIRSLLAPPQESSSRTAINVPEDLVAAARATIRRAAPERTTVMSFLAASTDVPTLDPSLDLTEFSLSDFEAFVLSAMDGQSNVDTIRQLVGISRQEMQAVLQALVDKKLVQIREVEAKGKGETKRAAPADPVSDELPVFKAPAEAIRPAMDKPRAPPPPPAPPPVVHTPRVRPMPPPPKPPAAVSPLQRAIELEKAGDIDRAIEVLERAVAKSRDPAPLYNRLGIVLLKERRDFARAEKYLEKARELDPDNSVYEQNYFRIVALNAAHTGVRTNPLKPGRRT